MRQTQKQKRLIVALTLAACVLSGVVIGCCGCSISAVIISYL